MHKILINMIKGYQYVISPLRPPTCRFYPTCSHYACEALAEYGFIKGTSLSIRRIIRCHPWSRGGYDPIPK